MANHAARVNSGLAALGDELGSKLSLDDEAACAFDFADGLTCTVEYLDERDALFLWSEILTVGERDRLALFQRALTANANPLQLGGTSIGYDPERAALVLSFVTPMQGLEAGDVTNTIGAFLLIAAELAKLLGSEPAVHSERAAPEPFARAGEIIVG
ncbi:MAG: CesT family type III secretion system chaperone [Geminicoccaceae bacterium]